MLLNTAVNVVTQFAIQSAKREAIPFVKKGGSLATGTRVDCAAPAGGALDLRPYGTRGRARPSTSNSLGADAAAAANSLVTRVADGTRTHDHRDHNPGLYQLSYRHRVASTA
jgi:hypothetical protein